MTSGQELHIALLRPELTGASFILQVPATLTVRTEKPGQTTFSNHVVVRPR